MGISRHQHLFIQVALAYQFIKECFHLLGYLSQFVAGKEFQIHQHLVVARTPAVNLLAHIAQFAGEQHLHLRVHILHIGFYLELSPLALCVDIAQFCQQRFQFGSLEQSDALQHGDVCHRAQHIVPGKIEVHLAVTPHGEALYLLVHFKILLPKFHPFILHLRQQPSAPTLFVPDTCQCIGHLFHCILQRAAHHGLEHQRDVGLYSDLHLA